MDRALFLEITERTEWTERTKWTVVDGSGHKDENPGDEPGFFYGLHRVSSAATSRKAKMIRFILFCRGFFGSGFGLGIMMCRVVQGFRKGFAGFC